MSPLTNRSTSFFNELAEEFTRDHDADPARCFPSLETPRPDEGAQEACEPFAPFHPYPVAPGRSLPDIHNAPLLTVRQAG